MDGWFRELVGDVRRRVPEDTVFVLITMPAGDGEQQCQFANNFNLEAAAELCEKSAVNLRRIVDQQRLESN
jgi:hypothetical protein